MNPIWLNCDGRANFVAAFTEVAAVHTHVMRRPQSRRFLTEITIPHSTSTKDTFTMSNGGPPWTAEPLLPTRRDNPLLYAWTGCANSSI
jgi:hypothetical protein